MKAPERTGTAHVCKTFRGQVAKALDDMVNKRGLFSSYAGAVAQAILEYHRRIVEDDLKLSRLQAISDQSENEET
jgi:hypothetical protein